MNKLMMTAAAVALMAFASPVFAQSASPATSAPDTSAPTATPNPKMTAPNNSSVNAPQDTAPMSSKGSTSAVAPAAGSTQSSDSMNAGDSTQKPTMASHKMHHKAMETTKTSGSKSTDHDADQLNKQELGKLQSN